MTHQRTFFKFGKFCDSKCMMQNARVVSFCETEEPVGRHQNLDLMRYFNCMGEISPYKYYERTHTEKNLRMYYVQTIDTLNLQWIEFNNPKNSSS